MRDKRFNRREGGEVTAQWAGGQRSMPHELMEVEFSLSDCNT